MYYAGATDFRASRGWLEKFMKRHGFSLRRRTTVSQRLPKDLVPKVTMFIMATRRLRHSKDYSLGSIGNMDETPLWLDMPGATTITHLGERSVPVRTTGHEKNRFTVCLSAMADGRKLKPYVVFKGKRQIPEVPGVVVALSSKGWMNEDGLVETLLGYTEFRATTASLGRIQVSFDGWCSECSQIQIWPSYQEG